MRQHCGIGEMDETSCLSFGCCWSKDLTCFSPSGKYNVALTKKILVLQKKPYHLRTREKSYYLFYQICYSFGDSFALFIS